MENKFEIHYTRTKELLREYCLFAYFARPSMIACDCVLLALAAVSVVSGGTPLLALLPVIVIGMKLVLYLTMPNAMAKRDDEAASGGAVTVDASAGEDLLRFRVSNGAEQELPYAKMKKLAQTKHLILVSSEAKLWYIFPKDAFTKGTPEDFLAFLKTKGVGK